MLIVHANTLNERTTGGWLGNLSGLEPSAPDAGYKPDEGRSEWKGDSPTRPLSWPARKR